MDIEKLLKIDRRIVFIFIFVAVLVPFFFKFGIPVGNSPETDALYRYIDELPKGSIILISTDYDMASRPELYPMSKAIVKHAFTKGLRIVSMCLWPNGVGLAESCVTEVANELNKDRLKDQKIRHGKDYLITGYRAGGGIVIMSMGDSFSKTFGSSSKVTEMIDGKRVESPSVSLEDKASLPIMNDIRNYTSFKLTVPFAAGATPDAWIEFAGARYHQPIALGLTAVSAPRYYPFFPGQLKGLVGGLKGAAEYENLIGDKQGLATKGMDAQSVAHLLIILFIIIGNIAYFTAKKK
jgi:hypothetical protein